MERKNEYGIAGPRKRMRDTMTQFFLLRKSHAITVGRLRPERTAISTSPQSKLDDFLWYAPLLKQKVPPN